jgi:hypothetical protein
MKTTAVGHLDVDCFYVSAERVRDECLGALPVGILGNQSACVIAKSYEMKPASRPPSRPGRYGPGRDQAPAQQGQAAAPALVQAHDGDGLRRGDVKPGLQQGHFRQVEVPGQALRRVGPALPNPSCSSRQSPSYWRMRSRCWSAWSRRQRAPSPPSPGRNDFLNFSLASTNSEDSCRAGRAILIPIQGIAGQVADSRMDRNLSPTSELRPP